LALLGVKPGGTDGYFQPYELAEASGPPSRTRNVVGLIEGSDPRLKEEFVIVGAHYDHVGTRSQGQDRVFNGADDNGSGTVALLEFAQALAKGPRPKRSIVLIWFSGEERGLWGSRHYAANPTVPLNQVSAMLNMDMIGRSWTPQMGDRYKEIVSGPNEVFVIGSRKMSTALGALSDRTNQAFMNLVFNFRFDDPNDPMRLFYRSDHYSFAEKGVPAIFYFDGLHPDYHQVQDEVQTIDFPKLEKVARTVFATMWAIAQAPERMRVDKPLAG
ncbi:MAG: M20/M25/M40 family metallo-hydrolase, partial [Fimbriimonadaceae bacterium]|nr:M20/M25/M40 family metallo-hydrolase [Fimbriimonadaceae bacterium]